MTNQTKFYVLLMLFATAWMLAGLVHAWWWLVPAGFGTALGGFLIDMYEKSDS